MRILSGFIVAALSVSAAFAAAPPVPAPQKNSGAAAAKSSSDPNAAIRTAYQGAIKCFVVAGAAAGERKDAGDATRASSYEAAARRAFDAASGFGLQLGYTNSRINQDFGLAQASELPKLVKDQAYNRASAGTCKAMGLL